MGIQHDDAHAHVLRGVEAERRIVQLHKRADEISDNMRQFIHRPAHNTNHGRIKQNIPEGYSSSSSSSAAATSAAGLVIANKAQEDDDDVETVYSVVYQTLSQTFDGAVAGYVTESSAAYATASVTATAAATSTADADEAAYESNKSAAQAIASSSSLTWQPYPSRQAIPNASHSTTSASIATGTTLANAAGANVVGGTPLSATHAADDTKSSMTGGAKAGLALGMMVGLGLLVGLALFCWRRRKNSKAHEEITDEKYNEKSGLSVSAAKVNRFSGDSDKSSVRSSNTPATAPRLSLRPVTQFLPNLTNSQSSANAPNDKSSAWERRPHASAENPFVDAAVVTSEKQSNPFDEGDGHDRNKSVSSVGSTEPQFGTAAAVPVSRGPNNVHRVQLDFKPSMEDELELISGQLVRMLHEYDDGWALCIRMDRTQQGVVPRTCLSKLPVKPRGPPQGRPQGPPSNGMSSPPGPNGMAPEPLSPTHVRSGNTDAVPVRKPVPGQAL